MMLRDNYIKELKIQLEESLKEKDDLKLKLEKFETSSRSLTNLLNSQLSSKDKTGLVYDSQLNKRDLSNKSDVFKSASNNSVNESEEDNNQANDRYKAGEGYHAVPPPYTENFMPPRPDLSFARLDDFAFKSVICETITSVHETQVHLRLVVAAAKLPILNPNEFDLWKMRIEQYFLMKDYSLWEVILNGDSPPPTIIIDGVV
nr:ribonuclease H-like domain-containing protein [Tanacetum cinerariifolium]